MKTPEAAPETAPDIFDRQYKPSWLAGRFKLFADELVEDDLAHKKGDTLVAVQHTGLTIRFDGEGSVESVAVRKRRGDSIKDFTYDYRISFVPGDPTRQLDMVDGSTASFRARKFNEFQGATTLSEFERSSLEPGDADVNNFFHDMAVLMRS